MIKTYSPKQGEIEKSWHLIDATDQPLGRLCTTVATLLMGKHKASYSPHVDTGDFVIVVNAEKATLSGSKETGKIYYRHSTHPGGLKQETAEHLRGRRPTQLVERAVKGMLPKNKIGRRQLRKLKVFAGPEHPHEAQKPTPMALG